MLMVLQLRVSAPSRPMSSVVLIRPFPHPLWGFVLDHLREDNTGRRDLRVPTGGSHISLAIRGVRSGPSVNGESEELDPLRSELLLLRSASLLVSSCERVNVLTSFKACTWSFAICDFVGRVKVFFFFFLRG
ncbi:hypothetical protein NDU88_003469 [Pleurodeles waltl]|uniref:Secreted protein n=1 Tax=Pleurodeles waltl TaxID=8319 RepID=A0AAV7UCW2_PLEWA|nr:hypothetical protein NDU88_003469 [Pleurodeles waltl]